MLRKSGGRTAQGLWNFIGNLDDIFLPGGCANCFVSCGYDPESTESAPADAACA